MIVLLIVIVGIVLYEFFGCDELFMLKVSYFSQWFTRMFRNKTIIPVEPKDERQYGEKWGAKVGDIVSTRPCFGPWRHMEEIEDVRLMLIHGKMEIACRVKGLPYYEEELKLEMLLEDYVVRYVLEQ